MANNSPLYIAYLYKIYIQLGTMFHINYEPETVCFSTNTFKGFFKHTTKKNCFENSDALKNTSLVSI